MARAMEGRRRWRADEPGAPYHGPALPLGRTPGQSLGLVAHALSSDGMRGLSPSDVRVPERRAGLLHREHGRGRGAESVADYRRLRRVGVGWRGTHALSF